MPYLPIMNLSILSVSYLMLQTIVGGCFTLVFSVSIRKKQDIFMQSLRFSALISSKYENENPFYGVLLGRLTSSVQRFVFCEIADFDECAVNNGDCDSAQICVNTWGGSYCAGPFLDTASNPGEFLIPTCNHQRVVWRKQANGCGCPPCSAHFPLAISEISLSRARSTYVIN